MSDFLDEYFTASYQSALDNQRGSANNADTDECVVNDNQNHDPYGFDDYYDEAIGETRSQITPPQPPPPPAKEVRPPVANSSPPAPLLARVPSTTAVQGSSHNNSPRGGTTDGPNRVRMPPHLHTDTYETPLPAEALGAQQLVDFLFHPNAQPGAYSHLSPPEGEMHPKADEIGLPLPRASEPVNPQTGRRLVYLGRGQPPVLVRAEPKSRFIAVAFKPLITTGSSQSTFTTSYGTVLGYSDDNTQIIWQDRAERFASRVSLSDILMIHRSSAMQCRHCGLVLLRPELREHMSTHKKGSGVQYGVFTDDSALGMVCGDSGLMQAMVRPRKLGEGAQGVVELCDIVQPTAQEEARAGPNSLAFRHQSRHLGLNGRLTKAVLKTMRFDSSAEAWAQYQKSVRFMTVMENPHLVEYLSVQLLPDHHTLKLAMPYYSEGDLSSEIMHLNGGRFEETFICSIGLQLSMALSFLHERNPPIVHGDIKAENVMFYNNKEQIVLMDLDASCEVRLTERAVKTGLGTAAYMAPETMNYERLMPASDMWSLGILLYVLSVLPQFPMITDPSTMESVMLNAPSWASPDDRRAMEEFVSEGNGTLARPQRDLYLGSETGGGRGRVSLGDCVSANVSRKNYSAQLTQLIADLLSYNPWKRPTAEEVGERLTEIMTRKLLDGG